MSDDFVTIILITDAMRHRYPEIPPRETFMVIRRFGDKFQGLGTDEDVHHIDPTHWARDKAVQRDVEYRDPDPHIGFFLHDNRWHAYDTTEDADEFTFKGPGRNALVLDTRRLREAAVAAAMQQAVHV